MKTLILLLSFLLLPCFVKADDYQSKVWRDIQVWKIKHDGYAYQTTKELCKVSEERLEEVKTNWSHEGFYDHIEEPGFYYVGENLSRYFYEPEEVLKAWLKSPTHRANLEKKFDYSCLVCKDSYCVHTFGSNKNVLDN